ncbi:NAD(P)-dependent oxidoreductase [Methylobacterium aquaticum]|uniref:NAD(P)-dependent oxidoreductase n=1 Tax=Methylobacterium aquaticum TaxID=270351 RepID=UPI003D170E49
MNVGVIGLGLMGLSVARNLAKAGFHTTAYDVRPEVAAGEPSLKAALDVATVGAASEIVFLSLPGPAEVEAVCLGAGGLMSSMRPGGTVVDLSTNSMASVKKIAAEMAKASIAFLDGPVSGGPWGAADGTLAIWVGGDHAAFERAFPVLQAIGKRITHMGDTGTGTVTKLAHNVAANIRTSMLGEIMSLAYKAGIEPTALLSAVRDGSHGRTRTFDHMGFKILDRTFDDPAFRLRHARKDLAVALELGGELGVPLALTSVVMDLVDKAMAQGWGDLDSNVQVRVIEQEAGIDIPAVDRTILATILARD